MKLDFIKGAVMTTATVLAVIYVARRMSATKAIVDKALAG